MTSEEWNAKYRVGQPVNLLEDDGTITVTRTMSIAWELETGDHVIKVEGKRAGYLLSRITAR